MFEAMIWLSGAGLATVSMILFAAIDDIRKENS